MGHAAMTPLNPKKTAADQMDGGQARGQAETLFGQLGDPTRVAHGPD